MTSLACAVFFCDPTTGCVRPTLLRQMDMGSLTCAQMLVACLCTRKGGQAQASQHSEGGTDQKLLLLTLTRQGDRTQGLRIWNSDSLTTELYVPLPHPHPLQSTTATRRGRRPCPLASPSSKPYSSTPATYSIAGPAAEYPINSQ